MSIRISILMAVHNGAKWLPVVLDSIQNQTYPPDQFEVLILDNASTDSTAEFVGSRLEAIDYKLETSSENIGPWPGFEKLLKRAQGEYIVCMTDVILESHFLERAVAILDADASVGGLEPKIFQMRLRGRENNPEFTKIIDTVGFGITRSRKVFNLGQGEVDKGQYDKVQEIFAVEGAVPVFRKNALLNCRIDGHLVDADYRTGGIAYADDLDIAWRMRLFGWKEILAPSVIAYHDRSTSTGVAESLPDHFRRLKERRGIDIIKRRHDWSNVRFTIIKNDYIIHILWDLPYVLWRELAVFCYTILFEPAVLQEAGRFFRLLPVMLQKRREIMRRVKVPSAEMYKWFSKP